MPGQLVPREKGFDFSGIPDGEEVLAKMKHVLGFAGPVAVFVGIFDYYTSRRLGGFVNTTFRFGAVSLPIIGAASTFVLVTNGLGSLRKKNDHLNWFAGGFATGSLLGMINRNRVVGFNVGMFGGIIAVICKEIFLSGWEVFPSSQKKLRGTGRDCLLDFSLVKERPKNWTTGPASS